MAARTADDQAADRGHTFQIREPRAKTEEHQGQHPSQRETRARRSCTTAQDRAEGCEVVTVVYRMDIVVRVAEGT
jgi:hypothetical protein